MAANAWFKAQADAGTPVIVLYELEQPIACDRKADITAFEGETTVTGADAVEVIEGRVLRVADCMPFEIVRSNPNLLDNWYFVDPVNQRNKNHYTDRGYTIDRWSKDDNIIIDLTSKGIDLSYTLSSRFLQYIEKYKLRNNKQYTVSCLVYNPNAVMVSCSFFQSATGWYTVWNNSPGYQLLKSTFTYYEHKTDLGYVNLGGQYTNSKVTFIATKLEEGSEQTLARKIGDQWVLNDPPSNYQQELAKCQRYYISQIGTLCNGYITGAEAQVFVPTPVTMRANPIAEIVFADNIVSPDGVWNVLAITNTVAYKNGVKLNITTNRPSNSARTVCTTASSSFSFSAEL